MLASEEAQQQQYCQLEDNLILVALRECNKDGGIVMTIYVKVGAYFKGSYLESFWLDSLSRQIKYYSKLHKFQFRGSFEENSHYPRNLMQELAVNVKIFLWDSILPHLMLAPKN
ncbi:hypothetical protein M5689_006587 [Euphorbia peplus]|nr:hypothetical protein M5689_006587 [Euphorbia peplus]